MVKIVHLKVILMAYMLIILRFIIKELELEFNCLK